MLDKILDSLTEGVYSIAKKSPEDYCKLETTIGDRIFVFTSSTMATMIRFDGISQIVGPDESSDIIQAIATKANQFFLKECHEMQIVFTRDTMRAEQIDKKMAPMHETAKRLGMGDYMGEIFHEQAQTMAKFTMDDSIYIVLYTHPHALRKEDYKEWVDSLLKERRNGKVHVPPGTQDDTYGVEPLVAIHNAFVDQIHQTLISSDIGGQAKVLNVEEGSTAIARSIDPDGTSEEWKAWLLPTADQHLGLRLYKESITRNASAAIKKIKADLLKVANTSLLFPPPLKTQILSQEAKYDKEGYLEYGGRLYSTLAMKIPPKRMVSSASLVYALSNMQSRAGGTSEKVPYRLCIRLRGLGLKQAKWRAMIAPIVAAASYDNQKLMRAYKSLQQEKAKDLALATVSISLTTWVGSSEHNHVDRLKSRVVALRATASGWGDMSVEEQTIDRFDALIKSCPCLSLEPCSNEATGNIIETLQLIPWGRPASPLGNKGIELYRSLDGAILRTASHSSEQDYWLETMTAPMGGGKSAQANRKHLDYIFAPGRSTFPFLHIMDIGGSVSGLVEMLRDGLPENMKHLAYMHTLRNSREHAVNMLDTKLGLRYPLPADLQATVEWLTALATPAERDGPYENMGEFCKTVLNALYKSKDDALESAQPSIYRQNVCPEVDEAIAEHRIDTIIHNRTPWFQVADALGAKRDYMKALIAHRQAMPLLGDLLTICQNDNVRKDFMNAKTELGIPIPEAFNTQLQLARDSYPIFSDYTVLDLRGRRITAIDLGEVALKGNATARKSSSLMYQVGYELFSRNIRISEEDLSPANIPAVWMPYYQDLVDELKNTDKHVTLDEYHRTMIRELSASNSADHDTQGIRATLVREGGRESRKWGLSMLTISQLTADHGQLFSLASGNHILKRGSSDETAYQAETLGLSKSARTALSQFVNGPTKEGVTFLSQWSTKQGKFNQLFTSTVGPKTLWSLSSTFEDKEIRKLVFRGIGRTAGRSVLARHYPGGTAKDEVERRKTMLKATDFENLDDGACKMVADELIALYRQNPNHYS